MYLILLIVLVAAIAILFSQEFYRIFKKIFSVPGMKLLLPLIIVSFIVEYYEKFGLWLMLYCKDYIHIFLHKMAELLPFERGSLIFIHIFYLFLIASLPLWILFLVSKGKGHPKHWPNQYLIAALLWVFFAVLLTVHRP